jgi:hypothetical protein
MEEVVSQYLDKTYGIVGDVWLLSKKLPKINPIEHTDVIKQLTLATAVLIHDIWGEQAKEICDELKRQTNGGAKQ